MRKFLYISLLLIVVVCAGLYFVVPNVIYSMVTDYEPFTFERVLQDTAWVSEYEIGEAKDPASYGYTNSEEVTFYSSFDSTRLSAWYIPSRRPSDSTIFLIHGRTSNRLKTMKYLEIFRDNGLDSLYNVFIADLRNSGKAATGMKTYMGYKFAEDIVGGLDYLQQEKGQQYFTLYGFSMGAMAIYTMYGRDDLDESSYNIEKIIIDSPLSDVPGILSQRGQEMYLPDFVYQKAISKIDNDINGYFNNLTMAGQLDGKEINMLLIQSNHDLATPAKYTKQEVAKLNGANITTWFVDSAAHVKLYTHPDYREDYTRKVVEFLGP